MIPYVWVNILLAWLVLGALVVAVVLVIVAIFRGKGKRKWLLISAGGCLVALALFTTANYALLFLVQMPYLVQEQQRANQERVDAVSVARLGDRAPDFQLRTNSGSEFELADQRGKVVLLNFFATWCGPCLMELPRIQELWNKYGDRDDFALLVIGREETEQSVQEFMAKHGYTLPIAADPEGSAYSLYAEKLIPRTYLIARDGTIRQATTGFYEADFQQLEQELAQQLRAKE